MILAANAWANNAALIEDCFTLGYLSDEWLILDATFGRGVWWRTHRPLRLVTNDLTTDADHHDDFRSMHFEDATFDASAFDPPYVCAGGRTTTSIHDMHDRFGLTTAPMTARGVQRQINDGLTEMARITKTNGIILVKCKDYISSGALWAGTHYTLTHGLSIGLTLLDRFEHVGGLGPQPTTNLDGSKRRQVHARRNLSTLFVFQVRPMRPTHQTYAATL